MKKRKDGANEQCVVYDIDFKKAPPKKRKINPLDILKKKERAALIYQQEFKRKEEALLH